MARSEDRKEKRRRASTKKSHRRRRRHSSSESDSSSASSSSASSSSSEDERVLKKQRKRSEKVLASFGYTNDTNPFGDSNLAQPFVWRKKYEEGDAENDDGNDSDARNKKKNKKSKKSKKRPSERELKRKQLEQVEEIRKARQRRDEREKELEEMERLKSEELRLRDAENYEDWQQKEEDFHLAQATVRSKLRISQRREKPVDLLAKNLLLVDRAMNDDEEDDFLRQDVRVEKKRPHAIVEVLSMDELDELRDNIRAYLDLENSRGGKNKEFWELMMVVTKDRISRLRRSQRDESATRERGAIHDSVNDTIHDMLHGKNQRALSELKKEVETTIESAATTAGVDVEFWEEVSQQIDVYKARARLTDLHDDMLDKLHDLIEKHDEKLGAGADADHDDDQPGVPGGLDESAEARAMERSEANKGLDNTEEKLGAADEVTLAESLPTWSDKYQPRKPRYFNRVKTGYDWNKYNQTHYDHDNPPPKVVQGYKFNLFYPDLIDKTSAPRYVLEKANGGEFCIIRFTAGPPYQDIAFKIVNREWEHSHKRGFKSVFERGILHLYVNFKRHRYRR